MTSVVVAAHNEEAVIGACLDALAHQDLATEIEIVVSANGCTDKTADLARRPGVVVIDRPEPGKAAALNAGDAAATSFPRIYLDADMVIPPHGIRALTSRLSPSCLAAAPGRHFDTFDRPWGVRAYYAINERLPVFRNALFGRGVIALSETGRSRFGSFPEFMADDLFVDAQFTDSERAVVDDFVVDVAAPYTTRDLVRRLVRVRRANAEMRAAGTAGQIRGNVRTAYRWAWLTDVVAPEPRLALSAIPYVGITVTAAVLARRRPATAQAWARDESTRRAGQPPTRAET